MEEWTLEGVAESMKALAQSQARLEEAVAWLQQNAVIWSLSLAALILLLAAALWKLSRLRKRCQKAEAALARLLEDVGERLDAYGNTQQAMLAALQARQTPKATEARPSPVFPPQKIPAEAPPAREEALPRIPPDTEAEVLESVNRLLAGNQPFNLVEALRALNPRLDLQRMTPGPNPDPWASEIVLEHGGDGLFARVDQGRAWLYPNYNRFSTTLDPRPLFEGARHGARIHAVQRPALLGKGRDGSWVLREKGAVQMR